MLSTSKPLSISFYVPPPTPTPLPPRRPAFLTKPNAMSNGVDVLPALRRHQSSAGLALPPATAEEEEQIKMLRNVGVEVEELAQALDEVEGTLKMKSIRVVLLSDAPQLIVLLQAGLRYRLCLHGVAPRFTTPTQAAAPVQQSRTWSVATSSPGSSPERARVAGDSGVSFGDVDGRKRADSIAAPLAWALFEEPVGALGAEAGRGRLLQRAVAGRA